MYIAGLHAVQKSFTIFYQHLLHVRKNKAKGWALLAAHPTLLVLCLCFHFCLSHSSWWHPEGENVAPAAGRAPCHLCLHTWKCPSRWHSSIVEPAKHSASNSGSLGAGLCWKPCMKARWGAAVLSLAWRVWCLHREALAEPCRSREYSDGLSQIPSPLRASAGTNATAAPEMTGWEAHEVRDHDLASVISALQKLDAPCRITNKAPVWSGRPSHPGLPFSFPQSL